MRDSFLKITEQMIDGYALHEIICDDRGRPVDYRFLQVNPAFEKMTGFSADKVVGRTVLEVMPGTEPVWIERYGKVALSGQELHCEDYAREIGRYFEVKAYCPEPGKFVCIFIDITDRKLAEQTLRESEQRYRRLIEGLGEKFCFFSHDAGGVFHYVSSNFYDLFGVPAGEVIGRDWRTLNLTAESLEAGENADRQIMTTLSIQTVELVSIHPDGSRRIIEVTYGPVLQDGRVVFMEGICEDVTEKKRSAAELAAARDAAEAASQAKSDFLANISHELRTPLSCIIGFAELLGKSELSAEQQKYLQVIATDADHLLALVNDVLDLSIIEAGRLTVESKEFELPELFNDAVSSQLPMSHQKGLQLNSSISGDVPERLVGDPLRLKQILVNLLSNAIKFTAAGSVSISVVVEERRSQTSLLRFDVTDTGVGINPAAVEHIFQPFTQVDTSTTRKFGGSGLGLAICRRLCALMEGEIGVDSVEGEGSRFHVRIPFVLVGDQMQTSGKVPGAVSPQPPSAGSLRILLVDDNASSRMYFSEALGQADHQVDVAGSGAEALALFGVSEYDAVLMDIQMPVMDGVEALEKLRGLETSRGRAVPVIALTAHARERDRSSLLKKGFDGYLAKPVRGSELLGEVVRCIEKRRLEQPGRFSGKRAAAPG